MTNKMIDNRVKKLKDLNEQSSTKEERKEAAELQAFAWWKEAEALQKEFPSFSLNNLLGDEQARRQLMVGVSMKKVYLTTLDMPRMKAILQIRDTVASMSIRDRQLVLEDLRHTEVIDRMKPIMAAIVQYIESQI